MITATFTPAFARRVLDGLAAGTFDKYLSEAARERLRDEALRSIPLPEAQALGVRTRRGMRMMAVACAYRSDVHLRRWRQGDREPGTRSAPCTHFLLRYVVVASAQQIAREAAQQQEAAL